MQDALGQATISILNCWPNVALYRVDFMSEAEREELIKDSLHPLTQFHVKALLEQEEKGARMAERETLVHAGKREACHHHPMP